MEAPGHIRARSTGMSDAPSLHRRRWPEVGNRPPSVDDLRSTFCPCKTCPKVHLNQLHRGTGTEGISRLDNPFPGSSEAQIRDIARRIACQYHLKQYQELFEKAALLIHDRYWFDVAPEEPPAAIGQDTEQAAPRRLTGSLASSTPESRESLQVHEPDRESLAEWDHYQDYRPVKQELDRLTADEVLALDYEPELGFWDQPWPFRSTCYMLFTAAIVQGWIETSLNGADICYLDHLFPGIPSNSIRPKDGYGCIKGTRHQAIYGVINAAPFLFGSIGCWTVDWLNEKLMGRRRAIMASTILIFVSAIASAFMSTWWGLLVCRVFLGIGMGGKAAVVPVFLSEIAPAHIRATTIMNWQVFDALGIAMGFTANLLASSAALHDIWRWQVASTAVPSFALLVGLFLVSWDSPRYEMKAEAKMYRRYRNKREVWESSHPMTQKQKSGITRDVVPLPWFGKRLFDTVSFLYGPHPGFEYRSKAFETLLILRGHPLLAAKELVYTHCQLVIQRLSVDKVQEDEEDINFEIRSLTWRERFCHLFRRDKKPTSTDQVLNSAAAIDEAQPGQPLPGQFDGYLSRELLAAVIVMIAQQTCGINVLIFYSVRLFTTAAGDPHTIKERVPVFLSWGLGVANFIFSIPAYYWIRSIGRRSLALRTMPFLSIMLALAAGCLRLKPGPARNALVIIWTLIYSFIYSPGLGPVPFTLSAELFPLEYRIVGMSLAVSINFLVGGVFIFVVSLVPASNQSDLLGSFAVANSVVLFLVYRYVREPEVRPSVDGSDPAQIPLETIIQIYKWPHSKYFEFLRRWKWDPFRIFSAVFLRKSGGDEAVSTREYFWNWCEEILWDGELNTYSG